MTAFGAVAILGFVFTKRQISKEVLSVEEEVFVEMGKV